MSLPCLNTVNAVKLTYVIDGVSTTVYLVECGVQNGESYYYYYNEGLSVTINYTGSNWLLTAPLGTDTNSTPFGNWTISGYDSIITESTTIQNVCGKLTLDSDTYTMQKIGRLNSKNVYAYFSDEINIGVSYDSVVWYIDILETSTRYSLPVGFSGYPISDAWEYQSGTEYTTVVTENCDCVLTLEQELIMSYKLTVWKEQCKFAECVLQYLLNLQFGIFNCEALENLKNKRRILNILNCYDARDILNNTTDYNTITYTEIKELLNYL